jgi:hypothetical protein
MREHSARPPAIVQSEKQCFARQSRKPSGWRIGATFASYFWRPDSFRVGRTHRGATHKVQPDEHRHHQEAAN